MGGSGSAVYFDRCLSPCRCRRLGSTRFRSRTQIDYVQTLWDRVAATAGQVPLQDWQQALLEECLAEHRRAPDEARPWKEVIERVQERLRASRYVPRLTVRPEAELDALEAAS